MRPGKSHALSRARGRTHAPARAEESRHTRPRARHTPGEGRTRGHVRPLTERCSPRTVTRQGGDCHARTCHTHESDSTRQGACHARATSALTQTPQVSDFDSLALLEVSRHFGFIRGALALEGSKERGRGQGRGHHRGTGKGRWRSQARGRTVSAYHWCRDREVFSTYAACERRIWMANNMSSRVVDSKGCNFDASGGTLRVSKENKEMLCGKKTGGLYRLDWRGMSRQEELLSDIGPMVLARRMDKGSNRCTEVRKASTGAPRGSRVVQEHREMLWDMYGSLARNEWCNQCRMSIKKLRGRRPRRRDGATTTRKVTYFAAHPGGVCGATQWGVQGTSSYEGAGSEAVRKDNLKTLDYPPVGWRGRLLSPAHLDEYKPTWMSPNPVAKPKPDWSSYGVSM
ncbi:hypothetical protein Acr_15g0008720 [Actinidia rufa]|uniref:Uncharacterized protein n=1 Tax=Actinidia rufa TaxID=165716 RepID=A0A7J0FUL2_9ERIC|nr:hypothetical protein Acr_15g0008720 [Actinidia rufa]